MKERRGKTKKQETRKTKNGEENKEYNVTQSTVK
jgi:hypothetical protein